MSNKYRDFFIHFSEAPNNIIDSTLTVKLKKLSDQDVVKSDEVLEILDLGARYSLMSYLGMSSVDAVWLLMLKDEGKTVEQAFAEAAPRRKALEDRE